MENLERGRPKISDGETNSAKLEAGLVYTRLLDLINKGEDNEFVIKQMDEILSLVNKKNVSLVDEKMKKLEKSLRQTMKNTNRGMVGNTKTSAVELTLDREIDLFSGFKAGFEKIKKDLLKKEVA